jgi:DNA ligase (NAD+)
VVITGTLEDSLASGRGGSEGARRKATGSVSKSTFAVVLGESPGANKVTKAEQLGTPTIDEQAFTRLLETGRLD